MSTQRIVDSLSALYASHAIVFWHDADNEFSTAVEGLTLPGVQLVRIDSVPALQAKLNIERAPRQKWLLYSNKPEPELAKDWLLDIRLRSKSFRADAASILLEDLGLASQTLRPHLKQRAKFLRAKDRQERLKRWVLPTDDAEALDRKMLGVLARADQPDLFSILLRLFGSLVVDDEANLNADAKVWQEIVSNELDQAFWALAKNELGYDEAKPAVRDLMLRIFVTDFARSCSGKLPEALSHFVLADKARAANASVFAARWRSDMAHFANYNVLSKAVANELNLLGLLSGMTAESLADSMTFEVAERRIIHDLKDRIIAGAGANMETVRALIARRRDGHWANRLMAQASETTHALVACYDALEAAADFFELKARHASGFSFADAVVALAIYQSDLFRFDQFYRRFHHAADAVEPTGWALLHELRERIEDAYSGWFIPQLSSAWSKVLEGEQGLLASWKLSGLPNQQDFYAQQVKPLFQGGITKRVFVVISDAFRFEAAEELVREMNSRNRLKASLGSMLGVLPSYTTLGMAALLPHDTLAYKLNANLDVLADGQPTATVEQRSAQLGRFGGIAIKAEDLLALGKEKGRELVRDHSLVYVYHDRIDMIGDKQASETKTFEAVADTLTELSQLSSFIINSLNGSVVLITADHGFMYQESALDVADKSALDEKPEGMLKAKKRYLLGQHLGKTAKAWSGNTAITAGTDEAGSVDFWVPKGAARFHFAGGARFVHGSAMPQEIVVPLITVRVSESDKAKTRPVEFTLLGASNKVVTNKQRFEFIQTDAVSERVLPRTVLISLRDGQTLISDEQTLTFDSTSQLMDERKRSVMLTIVSGTHDRAKDYFLIARDAQTKVEITRVPLKIDVSFGNDF
ncbi:MAG: TIGR02687 family protein [Gallionellales bacterium RIFCSPLOWO2_02_FULL_59_110]|nr:MAG: TIGR02687 family protein [Gallionellales bacterium RIFCSPLOWO2_02_FULL_59_110]OGT01833.1 MAG: TIGR02687 family protein [Gallionellales bacterium RIFCSPLOWO2_02_58_13]